MAFSREREKAGSVEVELLYPLHEIDSYNGEELRQYIQGLNSEVMNVIINFSRVTYLNSSGLRELIQILKNLKDVGGQLYFTAVNDDIKKIFENTNLNRLFSIIETNEQVLEQLSEKN